MKDRDNNSAFRQQLFRVHLVQLEKHLIDSSSGGSAFNPRRRASVSRFRAARSAILAVQQVAHRSPPRGVHLAVALASLTLIHAAPRRRVSLLDLTALRTAVGKAGLVRLQLKFLRADHTVSDRKSHDFMVRRPSAARNIIIKVAVGDENLGQSQEPGLYLQRDLEGYAASEKTSMFALNCPQ